MRQSDSRTEVDFLVSELVRAGLPYATRHRILALTCQAVVGRGLRRSELKNALRAHVVGSLFAQGMTAREVRARIPAELGVSKRTAERYVMQALCQRTARLWAFEGAGNAGNQ